VPGKPVHGRTLRIAVVGTIGSGKTTCARKISARLGIRHVELDSLHWDANWVAAPDTVFRERVTRVLQDGSWVVDGNYHVVRDIVWSRADMLVWLDYSLLLVMRRLFFRTLKRILTSEKLWNGNQENPRFLFSRDSVFWWALKTYKRRRKEYSRLLAQREHSHLTIVRLCSEHETSDWLSKLAPSELA
jgi:adenylate kinase family enzyme